MNIARTSASAVAEAPGCAGNALPFVLLKPWVRWAARSALTGRNRSRSDPAAGRFTRKDIDKLLDAAWAHFARLAPRLPSEPTLGSRQSVTLACLTFSMLNALIAEGVERVYAIELIGDVCWKLYAQWGQVPHLLARLSTSNPARRIRISIGIFMRYPYNPPGWRYDDVAEPRGRRLDILRCPVADYLISNGAGDLCVGSWCNLDYPLARMWGGELERYGTIAGGADRCDCRYRAPANAPQRSSAA